MPAPNAASKKATSLRKYSATRSSGPTSSEAKPAAARAARTPSASLEIRRRPLITSPIGSSLPPQPDVTLPHPGAHREDVAACQHGAAPEEASALPVRKTQLRPPKSVLTIDPAGEPVARERRLDIAPEALVGD